MCAALQAAASQQQPTHTNDLCAVLQTSAASIGQPLFRQHMLPYIHIPCQGHPTCARVQDSIGELYMCNPIEGYHASLFDISIAKLFASNRPDQMQATRPKPRHRSDACQPSKPSLTASECADRIKRRLISRTIFDNDRQHNEWQDQQNSRGAVACLIVQGVQEAGGLVPGS